MQIIYIPSTAHLNRLLLLIIDGHPSHVGLKIVDPLKKHEVIRLLLSSHFTHPLEPWDVVLSNVVKAEWSSLVKNHLTEGNKYIKDHHFLWLIKKLFVDKHSFSPCRIVSSFVQASKRSSYRSASNCDGFPSVWVYVYSKTMLCVIRWLIILRQAHRLLLPSHLSQTISYCLVFCLLHHLLLIIQLKEIIMIVSLQLRLLTKPRRPSLPPR